MSKPIFRKRRETRIWKVFLSLLVCFPYGLALMWRKTRWHVAAKSGVTLCVAALVCVVLLPITSPPTAAQGGVQIIGTEKDVEVYGPELPSSFDESYAALTVQPSSTQSLFSNDSAESSVTYVYANQNGKYYHRSTCKYVAWYSVKMGIPQAHFAGYTPCELCTPDAYTPG